jgi:hypothetical protein
MHVSLDSSEGYNFDGSVFVKRLQIRWPQEPHVASSLITVEHLKDNDELVILVDDGSGDGQPECIWSSVS